MSRRKAQLLLDGAKDAIAAIEVPAADGRTIHAPLQTRELFLRFRCLPFARWQEGRSFFDVHGMWQDLGFPTESPLTQLILILQNFPNPPARDCRLPSCRGWPERSVQSLVAQALTRGEITPPADSLYEQGFAPSAGQSDKSDLLTVMRTGHLALAELKDSENVDPPV